jgi:Sec-independent protein secretion pathway component TatC
VSEFAILAGAVLLIVGVIQRGGPALVGGVVLCLLGVTEVTAREHLSGYRSHTVLLAAIPAVVAEFVIVLTVGTPAARVLLLVPVAAVFGASAWFLRRRFLVARQARLAKPLPKQ